MVTQINGKLFTHSKHTHC